MPAPPAPARVSKRVCWSKAFSSVSSRLRPTNELVAAGSVDRAARVSQRVELRRQLVGKDSKLTASFIRPVVVAVLRKELAAVERERRPICRRRAGSARIGRGENKPVDVDLGDEEEHLVTQLDRVRTESAAGDVHRLMEVVRGGARCTIGPEDVHRLLTVKPMSRRESEELHELAGLLQAPHRLRDRSPVDGGCEAAEQGHAHICHAGSMTVRDLLGKGRCRSCTDLEPLRLDKGSAKGRQRPPSYRHARHVIDSHRRRT